MTKRPRCCVRSKRWASGTSAATSRTRICAVSLTPTYRAGCKRILYSPNYYQAVANPKTKLITDRIARSPRPASSRPTALNVTSTSSFGRPASTSSTPTPTSTSGAAPAKTWSIGGTARTSRRTGYHHRRYAEPVLPARPQHRAGTYVRGLHDRIADPLRRPAIAAVDKRGAQALAPTRPPSNATTRNCSTTCDDSVWNTGGCRSFYIDEHGVNRTLWSGMTWQYWLATRR